MAQNIFSKLHRTRLITALAMLLSACGGGDGGSGGGSGVTGSCSASEQKDWLAAYMADWYFWYRLAPQPDASAFSTVQALYSALLYTGSSPTFPTDRWSYVQSTDAFNRFFGDGATLGYGVSVAGLELLRNPALPLYVRYVEAASPAAAQGVSRGDQVLSINGRNVGELIAADDFSALTPQNAGDALTLVLRRQGTDRSVVLTAAVFSLTPVTGADIITTAGGQRVGYISVKDMVSQALAPYDAALTRWRDAGVQQVVLDLRYNGGGLVSTGATLASYLVGPGGAGLNYATLLFNDRHSASNSNFRFSAPAAMLTLPRVIVLMGRRTCSASEQLIQGLRGAGVDVVAIGETTCGKPVGFQPREHCGQTYSAVNFESVNQRGDGRYFSGLAPTCAVAEDFSVAQGGAADPLMRAARAVADTGSCPAATAGAGGADRSGPLSARGDGEGADMRKLRLRRLNEGDEQRGMIPR